MLQDKSVLRNCTTHGLHLEYGPWLQAVEALSAL